MASLIRNMQITRRSFISLVLLLGASALLDTIVAVRASTTVDEPHHIEYGARILHFEPDRLAGGICDSQMPVSALNAAPQVIASYLESHHLFHPIAAALNHFKVIRIPTILATLALDLLVYFWAYDLYGEAAALASCLLCVLSPNLIAHGTLATTDMYHALGVVGSLFFSAGFFSSQRGDMHSSAA